MIIPFVMEDHFLLLNFFLSQYNMPEVTKASIPAIGYVYTQNEAPIGMCFLRRIEGGGGFVDGLIAHPLVRGETRDKALNALIERCSLEAQAVGITYLLATCLKQAPILRAKKHGFLESPYCLLVKEYK